MLTLLPDLNIAALKYAHVHREHGGPIHSLAFTERDTPEGKLYESFAHLDETRAGLGPLGIQPHGQALGFTKEESIHGAISQAMEFWAWKSAPKDLLQIDSSSLGFAAFPGLGHQGARKRAYFAAAEKFTLGSWWEGRATHQPLKIPGVTGIQISSPIVGITLALIYAQSASQTVFGVGTATTIGAAVLKARLQLQRNRDWLFARYSSSPTALHRLKYFSIGSGLSAFHARLADPGARVPAPALLIDQLVPGPWAQYAHVWRCLFDGSSLHESEEYFLL
jgi:hypothetical protein